MHLAVRERRTRLAPLLQADVGTRTRDPLLTMEVLYQLSYVGARARILALLSPTVTQSSAGACAPVCQG